MDIAELAKEMSADGRRWFPRVHGMTENAVIFHVMGRLTEENGEINRAWNRFIRGTWQRPDAISEMKKEVIDALYFLLELGEIIGIDWMQEYERIRTANNERFGNNSGSNASASGRTNGSDGGLVEGVL